MLKLRFNAGKTDNLYYFRDNIGNEIDVICDHGMQQYAIEIKSGQTVVKDFFEDIKFLTKLTDTIRKFYIIYCGNKRFVQNGVQVLGWMDMRKMNKT